MKNLRIGPVFQSVLGLGEDKSNLRTSELSEEQIKLLRMEIQGALAALNVEDMGAKGTVRLVNSDERRYRVSLKFTWNWPVPLALDVQTISQNTWEIELTKGENAD